MDQPKITWNKVNAYKWEGVIDSRKEYYIFHEDNRYNAYTTAYREVGHADTLDKAKDLCAQKEKEFLGS